MQPRNFDEILNLGIYEQLRRDKLQYLNYLKLKVQELFEGSSDIKEIKERLVEFLSKEDVDNWRGY